MCRIRTIIEQDSGMGGGLSYRPYTRILQYYLQNKFLQLILMNIVVPWFKTRISGNSEPRGMRLLAHP